jgi:5'-deoxynucleotidase YfbR-like HD superfamily hydrolase
LVNPIGAARGFIESVVEDYELNKETLELLNISINGINQSLEIIKLTRNLLALDEQKLKLDIDITQAMKIALVHDLAESITGDIDAKLIKEKIYTREEKKQSEEKAMIKIKEFLPTKLGEEINNLWLEYEEAKTKEARYIKALDKIETSMHIVELGEGIYDDTELIGTYGNENVANFPELNNFFQLVKEEIKKEFKKNGLVWKDEYNVKYNIKK